EAKRERGADRRALLERLARDGVLPPAAATLRPDPPASATAAEVRGAVHRFLARTPSVMVGVALDDLAGERDPVNLPGVGVDAHPSWTRKMQRALDEVTAAADVRCALDDVPRLRGNAASVAAKRRRRARATPSRATARPSRFRRRARSRAR